MSALLVSLLQWPIRALILLLISQFPFLGVEMVSFPIALVSAVVLGLLGALLTFPLKLIFGPAWAVATLGGLVPLGWLFDWLITIILFAAAAWLIQGFRLRNGLASAALGALAYSILCYVILNAIPGLNVKLTGAAALFTGHLG
jgi:putative membrane protein